MIREARLLFLVVLTYIVYAVSIYSDSGGLVFPYVLNEVVLFVVALQFAFKNRTQRFAAINIVLIGVFALLTNLRYWEMILSHESMVSFANKLWTDIFTLLFGICVLVFAVRTAVKQNDWIGFAFGALFIYLFMVAILHNSTMYYMLAYLAMTLSTLIRPAYTPLHLFWGLLLILELAEPLTYFLNTSTS